MDEYTDSISEQLDILLDESEFLTLSMDKGTDRGMDCSMIVMIITEDFRPYVLDTIHFG